MQFRNHSNVSNTHVLTCAANNVSNAYVLYAGPISVFQTYFTATLHKTQSNMDNCINEPHVTFTDCGLCCAKQQVVYLLGARKGCTGQRQQDFSNVNKSQTVKSLKLENIHKRKTVLASTFLLCVSVCS